MSKELIIDVAVLCQEYTQVDITCNNANIVNLDEIKITEDLFKKLFYPYGENFGIDKNTVNNQTITPYISFLAPDRKIGGKNFFLLEEIIKNIESDLNISRNAFTTTSLIDLTNEISNLKSLLDINWCSVLSSLPWSIITHLIEENHLANPHQKNTINVLFVVSVVFKTPTEGVRNTIIRFPYRIVQNINI